MRIAFVVVACGLAVAGCTKDLNLFARSNNTEMSAADYERYGCPELADEAARVSAEAAKAAGVQDYTGDRVAMDVGMVIFFPILVFTPGNYENPAEVARLNRTMAAIKQASNQKNCNIIFQRTPTASTSQSPTWRMAR